MRERWLACALSVLPLFASEPGTAIVSGRVFDVYHRPVPLARVITVERHGAHVVSGTASAVVDAAGMYRLPLKPGRYQIAVTPPPHELDFCTVFPVYYPDTTVASQAQVLVLNPGEIRPFKDFLLLEVESHRLSGEVTGAKGPVAVVLSLASGYTEPLRTTQTDTGGRFEFDHVPAGSYELKATGPSGRTYDGVHVDVRAPDVSGIRIHLRGSAR